MMGRDGWKSVMFGFVCWISVYRSVEGREVFWIRLGMLEVWFGGSHVVNSWFSGKNPILV